MQELIDILNKNTNVKLILSVTGKDQIININELPKNVTIYNKRLDKAIFKE